MMLLAYMGSTLTLLIMIPMNARITTRANMMLYAFLRLNNANNVATIITRIVRKISDNPNIFHPKWTSTAVTFAIVATESRHRYMLNGTWTSHLSPILPNFFPNCILFPATISVIKKNTMIITERITYWYCQANIRPMLALSLIHISEPTRPY